MTTLAIRRLYCGLRARYHVWNGRRAYRAGRLRVAGHHLDLALASGHSSFGAYLLLGKVAYRIRDMQRAMDCFRLARRTDPSRYALEGFPSGFIESLGRHPTAQPRQKYRIVIEPTPSEPRPTAGRRPRSHRDATNANAGSNARRARAKAKAAESEGAGDAAETEDALGDFKNRAEQEQAKARPMFSPGEWADIDWDIEARKLFGE